MEEIKDGLIFNMHDESMPTGKVSFEEFWAWADEDTNVEWVDGEIIVLGPFTITHQELMGFLLSVMSSYVQVHQLGVVSFFGYTMRLASSARTPDLVFIANNHMKWLLDAYLDGPADLAVEIILPESAKSDREVKFAEYEAAGVSEYWLIDPNSKEAEFYQLNGNNQYQRQNLDDKGNYFSRELPGFWLKPEWLWQDPLPKARTVLHELDVL